MDKTVKQTYVVLLGAGQKEHYESICKHNSGVYIKYKIFRICLSSAFNSGQPPIQGVTYPQIYNPTSWEKIKLTIYGLFGYKAIKKYI